MLTTLQPGKRLQLRANSPALNAGSEDGIILLAVLFLVVLLLIAMAVAAPKIARSIQRDKELEAVHRGEQYKRAIKLYYKKYGAYPTSIDQLINTDNIRFLRRRYPDPITGKDDWRLIYLGQAKVPPLGFFGQPLTGLPGATGVTGATNIGTPASNLNGSSPTSASPFGSTSGSTFGSTSSTFGSPNSSMGNPTSATSPTDSSGSTDSSSTSGAPSSPTTSDNSGGSTAMPGTSSPTGTGTTTTNGTTSTSPFGAAPGSNIGGGPIVGVGIPSEKASLLEYKKQKKYNQWEFVYNPIEDQLQGAGMLNGGNQTINGASPAGSTGTGTGTSPFGNNGSTFGNSNSNSSGSTDSNSSGSTDNGPSSNQPQPQQQ